MLRPLLNVAYWAQVQSMSERERRRYDAALNRDPAADTGSVPGVAPGMAAGQQMLLGMMRGGGGA
jgi:hypothetical protein